MKIAQQVIIGFTAIMFTATFTACMPGGDGYPPRKKMPELNGLNAGEGAVPFSMRMAETANSGFDFSTREVNLLMNGKRTKFIAVSVPQTVNDSLILGMLNSFKPFAIPIIASWAKQYNHGLLIDLSDNDRLATRTDYLLERSENFSIPVVILWDSASAGRLSALKSLIGDLPETSLNCLTANDADKNISVINATN